MLFLTYLMKSNKYTHASKMLMFQLVKVSVHCNLNSEEILGFIWSN